MAGKRAVRSLSYFPWKVVSPSMSPIPLLSVCAPRRLIVLHAEFLSEACRCLSQYAHLSFLIGFFHSVAAVRAFRRELGGGAGDQAIFAVWHIVCHRVLISDDHHAARALAVLTHRTHWSVTCVMVSCGAAQVLRAVAASHRKFWAVDLLESFVDFIPVSLSPSSLLYGWDESDLPHGDRWEVVRVVAVLVLCAVGDHVCCGSSVETAVVDGCVVFFRRGKMGEDSWYIL